MYKPDSVIILHHKTCIFSILLYAPLSNFPHLLFRLRQPNYNALFDFILNNMIFFHCGGYIKAGQVATEYVISGCLIWDQLLLHVGK